MSPSSLIFIIIVAIWAVYLMLHVARRREHLATARNVDRFSAEMRVLQRRAVKRTTGYPPATAASLTRAPILTASAPSGPVGDVAGPGPAWALGDPNASAGAAGAGFESGRPEPRRGLGGERRRTPVRSNRFFALLGSLTAAPARAVRAGAVLLLIALTVLAAPVAALGWVSWAVPAAAGGLTVALLAWLRRAARAGRATSRVGPPRRGQEPESAGSPSAATTAPDRPDVPAMAVELEPVSVDGHVVGVGARGGVSATAGVKDHVAAAAPFDLMADPRGWSPHPIPPPTYTLKARAGHPAPPSLAVPVPIDVEDDFDHVLPARRSRHAVNA